MCLHCDKGISARQQALHCSNCDKWQHRICGSTGITQAEFREAGRLGKVVQWQCASCSQASVTEQLAQCTISSSARATPEEIASATPATPPESTPAGIPKRRFRFKPAGLISIGATERRQLLKVARSPPHVPQIPYLPPTCNADINPDPLNSLVLPPCEMPVLVDEEDLGQPAVIPEETPDYSPDPEYIVEEGATRDGRPMLIDSAGFSYTLARPSKSATNWRCSVRNKDHYCSATVRQVGETYTRGPVTHAHAADPAAAANARIKRDCKKQASEDLFELAGIIAERVIAMEQEAHGIRPGTIDTHNLTRIINKHRLTLRPRDPSTLEFEFDNTFIPDFLVGDVTVTDSGTTSRHLIFATELQLGLLARAKTWYVDGTFKVVKKPFYQMWSIHAFVQQGNTCKQLPLVYVLMSSRRTVDYVAVFNQINSVLPIPPHPWAMVLDFESSVWKAIREVYPGVTIRGCAFHWTQTVFRHIKSIGLQSQYLRDLPVRQLCKQYLALCFIPASHIRPTYDGLGEKATTDKLQELHHYVGRQWIEHSVWPPENWSVFGQSIRTNNDAEGWHNRLNLKAKKAKLPLYMLVQLLFNESRVVSTNVTLLCERRLKKYQKSKYKSVAAELQGAWESYMMGKLQGVGQFLDICGQLYNVGEE